MGWGENDRGVSFTFGAEVAAKFLHKHDFDLICRAHQVVEDGYEFFAKRQLVTLFSAPNYCGEFDNAGAMMSVDETLMCSFQILKVNFSYFCFFHSLIFDLLFVYITDKGAFTYDVRCFRGIFDLCTYLNQILIYISLFSKIRCSLTYLSS